VPKAFRTKENYLPDKLKIGRANLHGLDVDDKTLQTLLLHSSFHTKREIYIKVSKGKGSL